MRDNAVERLFSLFTSSDRAEAIAGDLAEEREQRGWIWFWLHVLRVTIDAVAQRRDGGAAASARARVGWAACSSPRLRSEESPRSIWFPSCSVRRELDRAVALLVGWSALDRRVAGGYRAAARHGGVRDRLR